MVMNKESYRILIVEDDKPSSVMLKRLLEKAGYHITDVVSSGEDAIKSCGKRKPDLILMDITLKGKMDGIEAAKKINDQYNIPYMYLTVNTDEEVIQRARQTVPYGYLVKPYNKTLLGPTIEMAFARIEAEEKSRESEKRNSEILSSIPDVMFRLGKDGSFWNDIDAHVARDVWNQKIAARSVQKIQEVLKSGRLRLFEYALKRKDDTRYYEARIIHAADDQVLVLVRDVSDKKQAEKEIEQYRSNLETMVSERTRELSKLNNEFQKEIAVRNTIERNLSIFSHAIKQSPSMVVFINMDGVIEYVNETFSRIFGRGFDDVVGRNVISDHNPVLPEPDLWKVITERENWDGEIYNVNAQNELVYLYARVSSIRNEEDEISHYIIIADDITEAKKEKESLKQIEESLFNKRKENENIELEWHEWKEKMLSRNISRTDKSLFRNINNSFTQGAGFGTLITLFDLMNKSARVNDGTYVVDKGLYDLIVNNVSIAQDAFKTFTNIDWIISNEIDLEQVTLYDLYQLIKAVVEKVSQFLEPKEQKIVVSEYKRSYSDVIVNVNREHLYTALQEILINAIKFSKRKTVIAVMLYILNNNALISVVNDPEKTDEGFLGIPSEYEKVVFEPFYRLTKYVYEQYKTLDFGLGLTLVEKIINKHGGEIVAENITDHTDLKREPLKKVNVSIMLPLHRD